MSDDKRSAATSDSAKRLFYVLVVAIFVVEALVMLLLGSLPPLPAWSSALLDSSLLTILLFPVIYLFVLRPSILQIASLRQANDDRAEALGRLQKIASRLPGVVFQLRYRKDGSYSLPYASEALGEIYRVSPEAVRDDATPLFANVHPDDLRQHISSIETSARNMTAWHNEYRLRFTGEPDLWLLGDAVPQQEADGSVLWHGFVTDISERKRNEAQLEEHQTHLEDLVQKRTIELSKALDEARLADRTKDAFLANMSHELRTPLNAVIGMAGLANNLSTDPRQRDYLGKIVNAGKHLGRIINDLLDLSKIAAGHMEFESVAFSLRTLVEHGTSLMAHRADEKGLQLVARIADDVPDTLRGDPSRIEQILLNLVGNAIKFTPSGRVEIRVGLHAHQESRVCLKIEIEDTGIGMRPEDLKRLFQPFAQADPSISRNFGGTGLGLAISRRLAEMMDGDISINSREAVGTCFTTRIWVDLGNPDDIPASTPAADECLPPGYRNAHVLVAEDQPLNREIVEALLAAVGIVPIFAENGRQALEILEKSGHEAFDVVMMDIQMPIMDGVSATRELRSRPGFESLPVIAMTAHALAHEKDGFAEAGMNDHIGKPFENAVFYRMLAKWIPATKREIAHAPSGPNRLPEFSQGAIDPQAMPDVDIAAALARFHGHGDRYVHWLKDFVATAGAIPGKIRSEVAAGNHEQASSLAHAFKGHAGTLGMTELQRLAATLELALREKSPTEDLLTALDRMIAKLTAEIRNFMATSG